MSLKASIIKFFNPSERKRKSLAEEEEMKRICKEATAACLKEIHDHCIQYLDEHKSNGSYEEWVEQCHPDNMKQLGVDHRFYNRDSDHRIIWNSYCDMKGFPELKKKYYFRRTSSMIEEKVKSYIQAANK